MGWKPGESGNPGGRPKKRHDLQALARTYTPLAIATLVSIARTSDNDNAPRAAADSLLNRGWGTPENAATVLIGGAENNGAPMHIEVSFVAPQPAPDDDSPPLLQDLRSPHLPHGRRN